MSRTPTLWVSQPIEIRSTPVAAMCGAVAGVMRPEASVTARPATIATASVSVGWIHIVEQYRVYTVIERLAQLIERIDFEFDLDQVADAGFRPLQRLGYAAGDGDVIVLDQHGIVEAEPVIAATANADRIFFDGAQPGVVLRVQTNFRLVVCGPLRPQMPLPWRFRSGGTENSMPPVRRSGCRARGR